MTITNSHRRTRWLAAAAIPVAAGLALSGCATGGGTTSTGAPADEGTPVAGGNLDIAFWPDNPAFSCVDPFQVYWIEHRSLIRNFADSLTDQDPETGEIVPWIATDWEISDDGLEYTFNLRDGVTFSDGEVLDAAAVKVNFDENAKAVKEVTPTPFGASYLLGYESSEVIDDDTVQINFSQPNSSFLQATSTTNLALISPKSYENTAEERCLGGVSGSGLFVLDSYKPGESATLSRRAGYSWGSELYENTGEAHLDGITVSYVAEDSVRVGNLTSGAIDIAWPRNPFTVEDQALISASNAYIEKRSLPGVSSALFPNVSEGHALSDLKVRQALYKALDLASYASTIYGDDYPVVGGAFDTTTPYYVSQADKLGFDPEGAAALLDEAGWTLGSDGYRTKDGQTLTLSLLATLEAPGDVLIQDQLKQVGIKLDINIVTGAERPDVIANGDYDLVGNYFTRADPGALQFILVEELANSKAQASFGQDAETAAEVKELFDTAVSSTDQAEITDAYTELQSLLIDKGVVYPIFERLQFAGVSNKVHGFNFTSESFIALNDTWITE